MDSLCCITFEIVGVSQESPVSQHLGTAVLSSVKSFLIPSISGPSDEDETNVTARFRILANDQYPCQKQQGT